MEREMKLDLIITVYEPPQGAFVPELIRMWAKDDLVHDHQILNWEFRPTVYENNPKVYSCEATVHLKTSSSQWVASILADIGLAINKNGTHCVTNARLHPRHWHQQYE